MPQPSSDGTHAPTLTDRANARGIAWIMVSVLAASAVAVSVRALSLDIDSRMVVLIRSVLICAAFLVALPVVPRLRRMRFSRPWLHIGRGALLAIATQLAFYTLANVPLATATILFFTAPIFATILATLLQGEKVGPRRWAAVAAGFVGAIVILRPGTGEINLAMLAGLACSAVYAVALIQSRAISEADGPVATFASTAFMTLLIAIPTAAPVLALPSAWESWALLGIMVLAGALRSIADLEAYAIAEASVLAPITYTRIVIVGVAGYVFFDETLDAPTILGAAIVILSTLYIAQREARQRRGARPARAAGGP